MARDDQPVFQREPAEWNENFTLHGFGGGDLEIYGRLFSEGSFFDDDTGILTRIKLFVLPDRRLVYSIASGASNARERRVYVVEREGELCHLDNGYQRVSMPTELLFAAVYGLCGLGKGQEEELRSTLADSLKIVGA